jgi:two-component system, chemotaxis family, sensor kinase CheA
MATSVRPREDETRIIAYEESPVLARPFLGIAAPIAIATSVVLAMASTFVAFELTAQERSRLVQRKLDTTDVATKLFAAYEGAAIDFNDTVTIGEDVATLRAIPDLVSAGVWIGTEPEPIAVVGRPLGDARTLPRRESQTIDEDTVVIVRRVRGRASEAEGWVRVTVSLARENAAYIGARNRIVMGAVVVSLVVVLLLLGILRVTVTQPLGRLVSAARGLARGERAAVVVHRHDEVGVLSDAFNQMTRAIVVRERKIAATSARLQGLLDHMGQAIVVFDLAGKADDERSRQANAWLSKDVLDRATVVDALYPQGRASEIERDAFTAWLGALEGTDEDSWKDLVELAPTEITLANETDERVLELAFRPFLENGHLARVMMLATDVTARRNLLASVAARDLEHARQISAMRRLVAGGAQVFVRFVDAARERFARSRTLTDQAFLDANDVAELFRHVHTLRGEARCFDLSTVEAAATQAEADLVELRSRPHDAAFREEAMPRLRKCVATMDSELERAIGLFVAESPIGASILDQVTVLRSDVERLVALTQGRRDQVALAVDRLAARPFGECVMMLAEFVPRWAERESKEAILVTDGAEIRVPLALARTLEGVLGHLVRNAIVHGIEAPDARERAGKPTAGVVTMRCIDANGSVVIEVTDDGAGFDVSRIESAAQEAGVKQGKSGIELAFAAGVSTSAGYSGLAGKGVGLDAVRADLTKIGYAATVESTPGAGATIRIRPLTTPAKETR